MEITRNQITVQVTIKGTPENIWKLWTTPADIMQWNVPSDVWHTPHAELDMKDGGDFYSGWKQKMAARLLTFPVGMIRWY